MRVAHCPKCYSRLERFIFQTVNINRTNRHPVPKGTPTMRCPTCLQVYNVFRNGVLGEVLS